MTTETIALIGTCSTLILGLAGIFSNIYMAQLKRKWEVEGRDHKEAKEAASAASKVALKKQEAVRQK